MAERRQAHRRESIEVQVRDKVLEARPLSWIARNDLGNEIMRQYSDVLNSTLQAYTNPEGTGVPQLKVYLNDKIADPGAIARMAYPQEDSEFFDELDYSEILELIYAALDVNLLDSIRDLVDPNALAPMKDGGNDSSGTETLETDTQNQQPSPDSDSQDSVETKSSI